MKEWFQQNRWLGRFLIVIGASTLVALILIFVAKGSFNRALERFNEAAVERARLERLDPFPNETNYQKMKTYIDNYGAALERFKAELKTHALPAPEQLAPNEFQTRLREAITAAVEKARANKVKLPENFALGFEEFTAALPNETAAPLLGQALSQIQMLVNILIEARVDGLSVFKRTPLPEERGPAAGKTGAQPPSGPRTLERSVVELTFAAAPSVLRKVINQIASANEQIYIIRTLYVRNEMREGPPREPPLAHPADTDEPAATKQSALHFIVGNEHLETSARIEIVRFTY